MKIIVGSLNNTKLAATRATFPETEVIGVAAPSQVLAQPVGQEMTRIGAINRATYAARQASDCIGIGFEGGVTFLGGKLFLCNWGALVTSTGEQFTASGAQIELPNELIAPLLQGEELGSILEEYTQKRAIGKHEGAIGIFTKGYVLRKEMYAQIALLLRGQYEYWLEKNEHP